MYDKEMKLNSSSYNFKQHHYILCPRSIFYAFLVKIPKHGVKKKMLESNHVQMISNQILKPHMFAFVRCSKRPGGNVQGLKD